MKKTIKFFGIAALAAAIVFGFAACPDGNDKGGDTTPTPKAEDFDIGNLTQTAGKVTGVTIMPKNGKSSGAITVWYVGSGTTTYEKSKTPPNEAGGYAVTFDVAAATGWKAATGLSAGNLMVNSFPTPVADDYNFGNRNQWAGNTITAVTITRKNNASPGAVSNIRYNNDTAIPQGVGTYAVTFDVAAAESWNEAKGLSAGNLVVKTLTPLTEEDFYGTWKNFENVVLVIKSDEWEFSDPTNFFPSFKASAVTWEPISRTHETHPSGYEVSGKITERITGSISVGVDCSAKFWMSDDRESIRPSWGFGNNGDLGSGSSNRNFVKQ